MTPQQAAQLSDIELETLLDMPLNIPRWLEERRLTISPNDRRALVRWFPDRRS